MKKNIKKESTKSSSNTLKYTALGVSLAGIAATAYFFLGPKGKKHQQHAKAWAIKMKGDVIEKLEKARDVTEPIYHNIIDVVAKNYEKSMKASHEEITSLANDLKKHWNTLSKSKKVQKKK